MLTSAVSTLALPAITTLEDCSSYALAVKPFLQQLPTLPYALLVSAKHTVLPSSTASGSVPSFLEIYAATNPFIFALGFALLLAPVFLIVSEVTGNCSQVDRAWSILPMVYVAHYAAWARVSGVIDTRRVDSVLVFAAIWSVRLTFNYWRRGGYKKGSEDYRWAVIRERLGKTKMFVFNVFFVALGQSILLCLFTSPTYVLLLVSRIQPALTMTDVILARVLIGLILLEFFADQQQWEFQSIKKSYLRTAKVPPNCGYTQADLDRGFIVSGLWSWSRHPNFAAEQAIWLTLYQWGALAADSVVNWTLVGAGSLLFLFQGSTRLTEEISLSKYPEYAEYQKLVGMFLPWGLGKKKGKKAVRKGGEKVKGQ